MIGGGEDCDFVGFVDGSKLETRFSFYLGVTTDSAVDTCLSFLLLSLENWLLVS